MSDATSPDPRVPAALREPRPFAGRTAFESRVQLVDADPTDARARLEAVGAAAVRAARRRLLDALGSEAATERARLETDASGKADRRRGAHSPVIDSELVLRHPEATDLGVSAADILTLLWSDRASISGAAFVEPEPAAVADSLAIVQEHADDEWSEALDELGWVRYEHDATRPSLWMQVPGNVTFAAAVQLASLTHSRPPAASTFDGWQLEIEYDSLDALAWAASVAVGIVSGVVHLSASLDLPVAVSRSTRSRDSDRAQVRPQPWSSTRRLAAGDARSAHSLLTRDASISDQRRDTARARIRETCVRAGEAVLLDRATDTVEQALPPKLRQSAELRHRVTKIVGLAADAELAHAIRGAVSDEGSIVDYAAALWADRLILAHVEVPSPRLTEQARTHGVLRSLRDGDLAAFAYAMLASDETHYAPRIEMERCGQVIDFRADLATSRADLNGIEQVLAIAHRLDDHDVRLDDSTAILTFDLEALDHMEIAISIGALVAALAPHEGFVVQPVRVQAPTDDRLIDLAGDWDTGPAPWRLARQDRDPDQS